MSKKLSTIEVENRLNSFDFAVLKKPGRNKGDRGRLLEEALGMATGADLNDMIDGELKSFTIGESIAVTMLRHCLPDIIDIKADFSQSKVYAKLKQTIFVGFDRQGIYQISRTINETNSPEHFLMLEEDYNYVASTISLNFIKKQENIISPSEVAQSFEITGLRGNAAAVEIHRLEKRRTDGIPMRFERAFDRIKVVERYGNDKPGHRFRDAGGFTIL